MGIRSGKGPKHLVLIGSTYYYRKTIPARIFDTGKEIEIKLTLRTSSVIEAQRRSSVLESFLMEIIESQRGFTMQNLEIEQIRKLIRQWLKVKIDEMENLRSLNYQDPIFIIDSSGQIVKQTVEERKQLLIEESEIEKSILKGETCGETIIESTASRLLNDAGVEYSKDSLVYKRFCRELRKAYLTLTHKEMLHVDGEYEDYSDFSVVTDETSTTSRHSGKTRLQGDTVNNRISELLEIYLAWKESDDLRPKTFAEINAKCRLFIEITGDPYPEDINVELLTEYKKKIRKLPSNANKKVKYRNKSIPQLLGMKIPKEDLLSTTTVNNHLDKVRTFLEWMVTHKYIDNQNLPKVLQKIKQSHKPFQERDIFSTGDLVTIFNHPEYLVFKKPWEFWLPLIGLFSGMRMDEICQLRLEHVRMEDNIYFFDITTTENSKLKTQTSVRRIPVHSQLVEIGLIDYVKYLHRKKNVLHLFPDRHGLKVSPSHYPVKRINGWLKKIGINVNKQLGRKTFHSFRHTFETRCQELGLEQRLIDQIMGHSSGAAMSSRYGKPAKISHLKSEVMDKYWVENLELKHLTSSRYFN